MDATLPRISSRRRAMALLRTHGRKVLLAYLAASVILGCFVLDRMNRLQYQQELRQHVTHRTHTLRAQIEGNIVGKALMVRGLVATIATNPEISQEEFSAIGEQLSKNDPDIINVAAAPNLTVRFVHPLESNRSVLGLDYRTSAEQLAAVNLAVSRRQTVLAGPVNLVQGGRGFIARSPVFVMDDVSRQEALWGIVSVVIDAERFFHDVGLNDGGEDLEIAIRGKDGNIEEGNLVFGEEAVFSSDPVLVELSLPTGFWQLATTPKSGWSGQMGDFFAFRLMLVLMASLIIFGILYLFNILERKKNAESQLAESIKAIDGGFALYDSSDRLVVCNEIYKAMYDKTAEELVPGVQFEHIIREGVARGQYPQAIGREEEWIQDRLLAHSSANSEIEQQLDDGTWLKVAERKTADGGTVGFRVDITELKTAQTSAEQANHAKTEFLNMISHELRTPLTVILGFNAFLRDPKMMASAKKVIQTVDEVDGPLTKAEAVLDPFFSDVSRYSNRIETASQQLLSLISDMLDFSSMEAGKMKVDCGRVEVEPMFDLIIDRFAKAASDKGISLKAEPCGAAVLADEPRLTQVLANLVDNAIKFTSSGHVTLRAKEAGELVEFSVEDTGCGIPDEAFETIFGGFDRIDTSSTRTSQGTGLGLAIAKRLAELQGGQISLTSQVGKGSIFTVSIPKDCKKANPENSDHHFL